MSELDMGKMDVPAVEIQTGKNEEHQVGSFMNSTLQGAGRWAVSIATYLDLPTNIRDEAVLAAYIKEALTQAAAGVPGLMFDVQVGPGLDYDDWVTDDSRPDYNPDDEDDETPDDDESMEGGEL